MNHSAVAAVIAAAFIVNVPAVGREPAELGGEISASGTVMNAPLTIELFDTFRHQLVASTFSNPDGSFQFRHLEQGRYEMQISNRTGLLKREFVDTSGRTPMLFIRVDAPVVAVSRPAGASISVARLQHKAPVKAVKFLRAGTVEWLEKAVAIDPEFMEAHNDLGCLYVRSGDTARALQHLQRAVEIDPAAARAHTNLAIALLAGDKAIRGRSCRSPENRVGRHIGEGRLRARRHSDTQGQRPPEGRPPIT